MLKDITLGQFFPADTPVHRLDPRTKLLCVILYIVALVSANSGLTADVLADGGKITVSENITKTQLGLLPKDMQIKISATAVQYNGFSEGEYTEEQRALAAWEAVKNK